MGQKNSKYSNSEGYVDLRKSRKLKDLKYLTSEVLQNYEKENGDLKKSLAKETQFDMKQVNALFNKFRDAKGHLNEGITQEDFNQYFQIFDKSISETLFNTFDTEKTGTLNVREFIIGLATLSKGSKEEKLAFAFDVYDVNDDGYITREEMRSIFLSSVTMTHLLALQILEEKDNDGIDDSVEHFFNKISSIKPDETAKTSDQPKLEKEQLKEAIVSPKSMEHYEKMVEGLVEEVFEDADTRKDGVLRKDEFVEYASKHTRILQFLLPFQKVLEN